MTVRGPIAPCAVLTVLIALSPPAATAQTCALIESGFGVVLEEPPISPPWPAPPTEAAFRFIPAAFDATAPANVFPEDPLRTAIAEVTLERLAGDGARLDGRYVRVTSGMLDGGEPVEGLDGGPDFRFPFTLSNPDCQYDPAACARFDAANVYWHVDRVATAFWRDRMDVDLSFQSEFVVHLAGAGAFVDTDRKRVVARLGETIYRNAALEDDVLYHEMAHLAMAHEGFVSPRIGRSDTATAVSEGYADYMAATFQDDPAFGEYIVICPPRAECVGDPDDHDLRRLDSDPAVWNWRHGHPDPLLEYSFCLRYNEGDGKCKDVYRNPVEAPQYVWAMIWGSALWDLREALGPDVVDFLVLEAVRTDDGATTTIAHAADLLKAADWSLFSGTHVTTIQAVLANRGILDQDSAVEPSLPDGAERLSLYPNPATRAVTLDFVADPGPHRLRLFDVAGRMVREWRQWIAEPGSHRSELELGDLPAGVYLFELVGPRGRRVARLVTRSR